MSAPRTLLALAVVSAAALPLARGEASGGREPASARERHFLDVIADRPYLQYARFRIAVAGHRLTIAGKVGAELDRALVELLARDEPGIGEIDDALEVDPSLPRWQPGRGERTRIKARNALRRIREDARLLPYTTLRTVAEGSQVVVRGTVRSSGLRRLAVALAEEVARPLAVVDEIRVDREASRAAPPPEPDAASEAVERELREALAGDRFLAGLPLEVAARGFRVVVRGRVVGLAEHDYAVEVVRGRARRLARNEARGDLRALGPFERRLASPFRFDDGRAEVAPPRPAPSYVIVSDVLVE